jgi:tRNA G18 (ribose-2'-O)-methylase SpoU
VIAVDSLDDPRVQAYRWVAAPERLVADRLVVVEGRLVVPRLLALSTGGGRWAGAAQSVLLSPAAFTQLRAVVEQHASVDTYVAPQAVMEGLVGFNIHRGCLALARRPSVPPLDAAALHGARHIVVLEGVNNPDNVGGIFRSAAAFGADLVVLGPACADPLYRKSVRTSMGATLEVPYVTAHAWPSALELLRAHGCAVVALTTGPEAVPLARLAPRDHPVALLAGAEGQGLSDAALAHADMRVTIPMTALVDSLNVATAVSIALYHVAVSEQP